MAPLDPSKFPRHIAIIMDGNGRWAAAQGKARAEGHARGAEIVDVITGEAVRLGIGQLTLYCLSSENWKRPKDELDFLMALLKSYLLGEREKIQRQNIRFKVIGRREGLPDDVLAEIDESVRISEKNTGLTLCLAINYGSRTEIVDAVKRIVNDKLPAERIDEDAITNRLYTAGSPEVDLLIRTAGEMRISNYLLWQISYAELYVTDVCWPDFDIEQFHTALRDFAKRDRRFGSLESIRGAAG